MTADLGPASAPSVSFGALLRRLREAREATVPHWRGNRWQLVTSPLSQNELARRAGVDPASVNRYEGGRKHPSRADAEKLADGLDLGDEERARLLVAAGYWPWTDLDAETTALVLAAALAILRDLRTSGDYRRLVPPDAHKTG